MYKFAAINQFNDPCLTFVCCMMIYSFLYEIIKFTLAGTGVLMVAFYLFKPYLENRDKLKILELKKATSAHILPLRLQAHERLILLIDRINPSNMLLRLNTTAHSAADLQNLVINEVRTEFQHNVTQQLYVSARVWQAVKRIKEDTLNLVRGAAAQLPAGASGLELGKTMLARLAQMEHDPYDIAASLIRNELEELF